jgi:hypothetical protein
MDDSEEWLGLIAVVLMAAVVVLIIIERLGGF